MIVFLIGFMTAGKTTLGKSLAQALDWPFVDLDVLLEEREGRTITEIFEQAGEAYFRAQERISLESLTEHEGPLIAACGGGLPCFGDNMERLNELGTTLYFHLPSEELIRRIRKDRADRPLVKSLSTEELKTFVNDLLAKREPYYLQAQFVLEPDQLSVEKIRELIFA